MSIPRRVEQRRQWRVFGECVLAFVLSLAAVYLIAEFSGPSGLESGGVLPVGARCVQAHQEILISVHTPWMLKTSEKAFTEMRQGSSSPYEYDDNTYET